MGDVSPSFFLERCGLDPTENIISNPTDEMMKPSGWGVWFCEDMVINPTKFFFLSMIRITELSKVG